MGQFLNGNLFKVTAVILVAALISFGIWQWQDGDESQQTPEAGQNVSNAPTLPGLPAPRDRSAISDSTEYPPLVSDASMEDSADLMSERGRASDDGASVGDSVNLVTTGSAPGAVVGDGAAVGDSAETAVQSSQTNVQTAQPPLPSGGGPSEVAAVEDSAVLVVESASGEIKSRETVK